MPLHKVKLIQLFVKMQKKKEILKVFFHAPFVTVRKTVG